MGALRDDHPDYREFLCSEFFGVVEATQGFLAGLVENAESGRHTAVLTADSREQSLFQEIGREHSREGREVAGLLAAYRIGATVAWRHIVDESLRMSLPTESLAALATALFNAVDQLSAASLRGYLDEESNTSRHREHQLQELAELLVSDRADTAAVRALAARAQWPLPARAALVLIPDDNALAPGLLARLGPVPWVRRADSLVAVVSDADGPGRRRWLTAALSGAGAVVSEAVVLDRLPGCLPRAQLARTLLGQRSIAGDPLFVDEHLDTLIVHHNQPLLVALREHALGPLRDLPEAARERLEDTLRTWLVQMGNQQATARELHVHPQTVRYRLARLRELFGDRLQDPASRAALLLAVAWGPPRLDAPGGGEQGGVPRPSTGRTEQREAS
ncbi:MAG TPA: helix-turn-helix domain-containing protein [Pseudonocardia sp.]|uniref:PucR family transcriptional regulator n=1 Tax=Pseudonocardia sp. TaxID=60912 RepID=UPI002B7FA5D4|nr:helix-turn-helix domain-containing protein [Pseudonocardia sp.]HTF50349.1 helix-turn-helix domain-containing protein [Pseudonocardia sp.]